MSVYSVDKLISEARRIAADYRKATGKPLAGISGEIAENDAARLLNLEVCQDKPGGYDAVGKGRREGRRVQIKGRAIFDEKKSGQRVGQMKMDQEWDSIMLVLMNEEYEPTEIFEASREAIVEATDQDSSRKKRGAMSVGRFKAISDLVWTAEEGEIVPGDAVGAGTDG